MSNEGYPSRRAMHGYDRERNVYIRRYVVREQSENFAQKADPAMWKSLRPEYIVVGFWLTKTLAVQLMNSGPGKVFRRDYARTHGDKLLRWLYQIAGDFRRI